LDRDVDRDRSGEGDVRTIRGVRSSFSLGCVIADLRWNNGIFASGGGRNVGM